MNFKRPYWEFLVKPLQKWDIMLEVFVVVSNIDECPEEFMRKNKFECLSILFNRVKESQQTKAKDLHFVLRLNVISRVFAVFALVPIIESCAISHENSTNNVCSVESNLDIILIIEAQICEYRESGTNHVWVVRIVSCSQLVQQNWDYSQIAKLNKDVEVISGAGNGSQSLETPEDALLD